MTAPLETLDVIQLERKTNGAWVINSRKGASDHQGAAEMIDTLSAMILPYHEPANAISLRDRAIELAIKTAPDMSLPMVLETARGIETYLKGNQA